MNVLHVILTLERAGAQDVVRVLASRHMQAGCGSFVVTFEDGAVRQDLEAMGIPVEVLGVRQHGIERPLAFLAEQRSIRRRLEECVRRWEIDIVQAHILHTLDFLVLSLRRVPPVKTVIWTVQNSDYLPDGSTPWTAFKQAVHRWLYRANAGKIGAMVAVSEKVREVVEEGLGDMGGKLMVIPNGVELERFDLPSGREELLEELDLDPDSQLLLTVGRLTEQKGQVHLLRAMAALAGEEPRARLLVAGRGELEAELRAETRRLGIEERVCWLGERADVPRLLRSVDVFVLPSLWEGLSVALLEAMAAGLPIVATRVAGTDQVLEDGDSGLVVPPADDSALAAALVNVLGDPSLRERLGLRARQVAAQGYSAAVQADRYLALYRELLAS